MEKVEKVLEALKNYVRINDATRSVEIYDDYGVKVRLYPDDETFAAFKANFRSF